jgi:hypothetical protein
MRTTIDLPDNLFRRTKALAAVRGTSMKDLIIGAVEREVNAEGAAHRGPSPGRASLPVVHLKTGRKLDLGKFDFDDLLA